MPVRHTVLDIDCSKHIQVETCGSELCRRHHGLFRGKRCLSEEGAALCMVSSKFLLTMSTDMLSPCGVMLGGGCRYGSHWKESEAEKNLLRTHTTAVSSRMLYKLAQEGFKPAKYFSIDRVFRNEAIDRTHLAEFHQIEGGRPVLLHCILEHIICAYTLINSGLGQHADELLLHNGDVWHWKIY